MKTLFQFLNEARVSQASQEAKKLNLTSDGHGSWRDSRGKLVAKTVAGKLKMLTAQERAAEEGGAERQKKPEEVKAQPKAAAAPQAVKTKAKPEDAEKSGMMSNDITVVFGRFNPPTVGHEKLLQAAEKASQGGDLKIYPSRTQDNKKNPLDPDMKVSYMRKMFPKYEEQIVNDSEMISIFNVLTTAYEEGYKNVNIIVGSDRQAEFENLANKYNKDLYDFKQIRVISAGVRDADAEGVEGMSASKMRKAVADNDFEAFKKGTPSGAKEGDVQAMYDAVRAGMGVKKKKEVKELWQIAPRYDQKGLRENYIKKKVFRMGDIIESLSTGLVGKIIRRGTNYLISVSESNVMFKSWIHDVMEYTEKKMEGRMRDKTHPNYLVGTGGYRKNVMAKMGVKKIKNFNVEQFINKYKLRK
jgi:nicotinamide mononucleotide adenylyltransferase